MWKIQNCHVANNHTNYKLSDFDKYLKVIDHYIKGQSFQKFAKNRDKVSAIAKKYIWALNQVSYISYDFNVWYYVIVLLAEIQHHKVSKIQKKASTVEVVDCRMFILLNKIQSWTFVIFWLYFRVSISIRWATNGAWSLTLIESQRARDLKIEISK